MLYICQIIAMACMNHHGQFDVQGVGDAVQGRFKQPVSYEDAVTGQRFSRPLKRLPSPWFLEFVLMLARQLSPSMQIGCQEAPYVLSPMISTAQVRLTFHCWRAYAARQKGPSAHTAGQTCNKVQALTLEASCTLPV